MITPELSEHGQFLFAPMCMSCSLQNVNLHQFPAGYGSTNVARGCLNTSSLPELSAFLRQFEPCSIAMRLPISASVFKIVFFFLGYFDPDFVF